MHRQRVMGAHYRKNIVAPRGTVGEIMEIIYAIVESTGIQQFPAKRRLPDNRFVRDAWKHARPKIRTPARYFTEFFTLLKYQKSFHMFARINENVYYFRKQEYVKHISTQSRVTNITMEYEWKLAKIHLQHIYPVDRKPCTGCSPNCLMLDYLMLTDNIKREESRGKRIEKSICLIISFVFLIVRCWLMFKEKRL